MDQELELELVAGGFARVTLPEPGEFASFYVFSMGYSGSVQFWELIERLMAAAGRPVCHLQTLRRQMANQGKATSAAQHQLLLHRGYGFGVFVDAAAGLRDVFAGSNAKLLFLRDPRDMIVAWYRHRKQQSDGAPESGAGFAEFLQSPDVEELAQRYRRLAELRDREQNVTLYRYEYAVSSWHTTAVDVVAALKLPIEPRTVAAIAADAAPIGDQLPAGRVSIAGMPDLDLQEAAELVEPCLADVLEAFGYAARTARRGTGPSDEFPPAESPSKNVPRGNAGNSAAPTSTGGAQKERSRFGPIFEPDPVLGARLKPNTSVEMEVLGRKVIMDVDATGCRPVIGQPAAGVKTLAVYGCSFTYGIGVAADETFCSQLQAMFPTWRLENHGVAGYDGARNLLQLEREARWNKSEFVTFCWIKDHLRRNVGDIIWIQLASDNIPRPTDGKSPGWRVPRAALDASGHLEMRSVLLPRYDLVGIDLSDFAPNPYYLDLVCFRLFERANEIVTEYGGHFFVTSLSGQLSGGLARRLAQNGIPVVNARLSGNEYLCLPDDPHANAPAHRLYAERIRDYLVGYMTAQVATDAAGFAAAPGLG